MTFRQATLATAILSLLLCVILVFLPEIVYWLFAVPGNEASDFLAKRAAMLFLGFATLSLLARQSDVPEVQRIVSASIAVSMGALALLGLFELLRGQAGFGILLAVAVECAICGNFFRLWRAVR